MRHCGAEHESTSQTPPDRSGQIPPPVGDVLRMPGQPLEPAVHAFMAERFGRDFDNVRIHTDPQAAESAEAAGAKAYTVGDHIAFQQGEYAPDTEAGRKSIAHELAHVVQQSRGGGSAPGGDADHPLEHCAEKAADQAASGGAVQVSGASTPGLARQPTEEDLLRRGITPEAANRLRTSRTPQRGTGSFWTQKKTSDAGPSRFQVSQVTRGAAKRATSPPPPVPTRPKSAPAPVLTGPKAPQPEPNTNTTGPSEPAGPVAPAPVVDPISTGSTELSGTEQAPAKPSDGSEGGQEATALDELTKLAGLLNFQVPEEEGGVSGGIPGGMGPAEHASPTGQVVYSAVSILGAINLVRSIGKLAMSAIRAVQARLLARRVAAAALRQMTAETPELIGRTAIYGNKALIGKTFHRNIFFIRTPEGERGVASLLSVVKSLEREAVESGAERIVIRGDAVINKGFMSPGVAKRLGYTFREIGKDKLGQPIVEAVKEFPKQLTK
jgi:uncharacterized protein DUF4157